VEPFFRIVSSALRSSIIIATAVLIRHVIRYKNIEIQNIYSLLLSIIIIIIIFFLMVSNFFVCCVLASIRNPAVSVSRLYLIRIAVSQTACSAFLPYGVYQNWGQFSFMQTCLPKGAIVLLLLSVISIRQLSRRGEMTAYLAKAFRMTVFLKSR